MLVVELQKAIIKNKWDKGFNTTDINEEFARLVGEVSECMLAYKKATAKGEKYDTDDEEWVDFGLELADIMIYLLGIAEITGTPIWKAVTDKMAINAKRTYHLNNKGVWVKDEPVKQPTHEPYEYKIAEQMIKDALDSCQ